MSAADVRDKGHDPHEAPYRPDSDRLRDRDRGRLVGHAVGRRRARLPGAIGRALGRTVRHPGLSTLEAVRVVVRLRGLRSEEHTYEFQSLMRISYAVFCLKKKKHK